VDGQERHERPLPTSRNCEQRNRCTKAKAGASMLFSPSIHNRSSRFRRLIDHELENAVYRGRERHRKPHLGAVAATSDHDAHGSRDIVVAHRTYNTSHPEILNNLEQLWLLGMKSRTFL
jgi:hypothetical protein